MAKRITLEIDEGSLRDLVEKTATSVSCRGEDGSVYVLEVASFLGKSASRAVGARRQEFLDKAAAATDYDLRVGYLRLAERG